MFSNAWVCLHLYQWHFPSKNHFQTGFLATEESTQIRFSLKLTTHTLTSSILVLWIIKSHVYPPWLDDSGCLVALSLGHNGLPPRLAGGLATRLALSTRLATLFACQQMIQTSKMFSWSKSHQKCDTQNPQLNLAGHSRLPSPWHGFFGIISWLLREFLHAHYLCFRKVDVTHNSSLAAHLDAKSPSKTESEVGPRSEDTHVEVEVCKYGFHDMSIQRLLDWGNSDKHPYF